MIVANNNSFFTIILVLTLLLLMLLLFGSTIIVHVIVFTSHSVSSSGSYTEAFPSLFLSVNKRIMAIFKHDIVDERAYPKHAPPRARPAEFYDTL